MFQIAYCCQLNSILMFQRERKRLKFHCVTYTAGGIRSSVNVHEFVLRTKLEADTTLEHESVNKSLQKGSDVFLRHVGKVAVPVWPHARSTPIPMESSLSRQVINNGDQHSDRDNDQHWYSVLHSLSIPTFRLFGSEYICGLTFNVMPPRHCGEIDEGLRSEWADDDLDWHDEHRPLPQWMQMPAAGTAGCELQFMG